MRITSISLRNYRVFAALDLDIPAGLVGIYGPNGAGKSTLLESVTWALYGRVRTTKADIRTAGTTGECLVEIGFEHDDHHYLVRRTVSGMNATVKARVFAGSAVVADGPTEVGRYIRSTLGMDETAFRSSVFAEQKQLAAFSDNTPEQRRRLILQLLGITPIEKARDAARADVRSRRDAHDRFVPLLPVLVALEGRLDEARSAYERARADAEGARASLADAESAHSTATADFDKQAAAKSAYDVIRAHGQAVRTERDRCAEAIAKLDGELEQLARDVERLAALSPIDLNERAALSQRAALLTRFRAAAIVLERLPIPIDEGIDVVSLETALADARARHHEATVAAATEQAGHAAAVAAMKTAEQATAAAAELDGSDACPLCGQELGDGFHAIRDHRRRENADAATLVAQRSKAATRAKSAVGEAAAAMKTADVAMIAARRSAEAAADIRTRRAVAEAAYADALHALGGLPDADEESAIDGRIRVLAEEEAQRSRLSGRIERRADAAHARDEEQNRLEVADKERDRLRRELAATGFTAAAHEQARVASTTAQDRVVEVRAAFVDAERRLAAAKEAGTQLRTAFDEAKNQHGRAAELAQEVRYLGRAADLLHGFRQTVVGMVGPRLSIEASALFNELTAGEYDGLEIDPDSYEVRILDGGVAYPSVRFSGSEVDLANLALRVAVSEQIRFQAGGRIGLLVLDEALASLDVDRKDRMLAALTRLSGRFSQILVVTHAPEVKERLPQAIEVVKLGARRATARVLDLA